MWQLIGWVAIGKSLTDPEPPFPYGSTRAAVSSSEHLSGRFRLSYSGCCPPERWRHLLCPRAPDPRPPGDAVSFFLVTFRHLQQTTKRPATATKTAGSSLSPCPRLRTSLSGKGRGCLPPLSLNSTEKPLPLSLLIPRCFLFGSHTEEALSAPQAEFKALPRDARRPGEGWKCGAAEGRLGSLEAAGWLLWPV